MGQVQSDVATDAHQAQQTPPSSPTSPQNPQPPSLDSLISEAAAYGDSVNEACIQANPDAFSKDILDDSEVNKEQEPAQIEQEPAQIEQGRVGEYKIIPPKWATESASPKSKL